MLIIKTIPRNWKLISIKLWFLLVRYYDIKYASSSSFLLHWEYLFDKWYFWKTWNFVNCSRPCAFSSDSLWFYPIGLTARRKKKLRAVLNEVIRSWENSTISRWLVSTYSSKAWYSCRGCPLLQPQWSFYRRFCTLSLCDIRYHTPRWSFYRMQSRDFWNCYVPSLFTFLHPRRNCAHSLSLLLYMSNYPAL